MRFGWLLESRKHTEMALKYFLIFTVILLVKMCVVETQGFFETSSYTAKVNNEVEQMNHSREKRETSTSALEYIVVVEVNVSQLILIELLKSSLDSISLQLDNSTTVTLEISTVCHYINTGYECRCEDQYVWPCEMCTEYGHCDDSNTTCACITGFPGDGQFCQPVTELTNTTACPTLPPLPEPSEYMIDVDVALPDYYMVPFLKELLMSFTLPVVLNSGANMTEISITTVCTLNETEYVCRCEDQYAWSYDTCRMYGMCDTSIGGTCGCIRGLPVNEMCQRDVDECVLGTSACGPNSICSNTIGGYNCSCRTGFTVTNSSLPVNISNPCRDVDECATAPSICGPNSICSNTIGGYNCSCRTGFTVTNSSLPVNISNPCSDVDECVLGTSACGPNSICSNTIGGYNCSCWTGFTVTNSSLPVNISNPCRDVDECATAPSICGPNSICSNTIGGYNCSCWTGFTVTNSSLPVNISNPCSDVDECVLGTSACGPNSICSNTIGGYNCSCWTGFTATNSSLPVNISNPCRDVDECATAPSICGPNSICSNKIGGYNCSCWTGFTVTNSSLPVNISNPCSDVDECATAPSICGPNSICSNTIGGYNCSCRTGFTATNPDLNLSTTNPCTDVDECATAPSICGPNSICSNTIGGYNCSCRTGFTATNPALNLSTTNPCTDVDECKPAPSICGPNSICSNTIGGYNCSCRTGFTVTNPALNLSTANPCTDVDECKPAPSICGPNSICSNTIGGYNCSCRTGFTVTNPALSLSTANPCTDVDECATAPSICGPNSICSNTIGGYNCSCRTGFTATNPALNLSTTNPCTDVDECKPAPSICGPNSICSNTIGGYNCSCRTGFIVTNPALSLSTANPCTDVDECKPAPSICGPNSICSNTIGGYNCSCRTGFTVTNPALSLSTANPCTDVDECATAPSICGPNSICSNTIGGYNCSCRTGFTATNPALNLSTTNPCTDVDECKPAPSICGPNSICSNTIGGYNCSCRTGFIVTNPALSLSTANPCTDVDECKPAPSICGPNSICSNTIGGYNCSCRTGFTVTNPALSLSTANPCTDVDECATAPSICGPNSICSNTIGGYNCSCRTGFTATNPALNLSTTNPCTDVDECKPAPSICGPNSICSNTIGGYNCSCRTGFTVTNPALNVSTANPCTDVDECKPAPSICGPNSICSNTIGGYNCSCRTGFTATNPALSLSTANPCTDVDKCLTTPSICGPNSTCLNTKGGYNCSCLKGFTALNSSLPVNISNPCIDVDECLFTQLYCGQNTNCTNTIGGYNCSCWLGFTTINSSLSVSTKNPCILIPEIPVNMSLTLNEKFDITLTNPNSGKYIQYKNSIENSINDAYLKVPGYIPGSVKVYRFRPGSVIADFTIATVDDVPNFGSANTELSSALIVNGFSVNANAFAESNECNLYQSSGKIYPLQELLLNCDPPAGSKGDIKWTVNGGDPLSSPDKYEVLNKNRTLHLKSVNSDYSGLYECTTTKNSLPNIQWQRILVQPYPNIQVGSDKEFKCEQQTVPLQCCAHISYTIEWIQNSIPGTLTPPGSGCITYYYTIQKQFCENADLNVIFTCRLSGVGLGNFQYSSKNITIRTTKKEPICSNSNFGIGAVNQNASGNCAGDMVGIQYATCNSNGDWIPTKNNCTLRVIQDLSDQAEHLDVSEVSQFTANLSNAVEQNSKNITNTSATIVKIVDLLNTIATVSQSFTVTKDMMQDFLITVDVIVSNDTYGQWQKLNKDNDSKNASSALLQSIEKIGESLSDEPLSLTTSNIQLNRTNFTNSFHGTFGQSSDTEIDILNSNTSSSITIIVFSALQNILPVRNATHNESILTDTKIGSNVVMIKLDQKTDPLLSLSFDTKNNSLSTPQCVFWNFSLLDGVGGWDSNGCEANQSEKTGYVVCHCNHTTAFSILMSPFPFDDPALEFITYIGVAISMGSLVLCILIEILIWKSMTKNDTSYMRHLSTVNLAASLLIADICFIIGAGIVKKGQDMPVRACTAVTFFMHFFYLALFFWMLLSALLLLYRTLVVFSRMSRSVMMAIAFIIGYGAPLLIAVITVAVTAGNNGYIQEAKACWLNWDKTKALLAFVIPALTIVVINILVLAVVLYKMLRRGVAVTTHAEEKHTMLVIARCVGILTPLFGLTWGFGIGTMVSTSKGIHIVFATLNSLQGFFILVFGTLLDNKIREAIVGKLKLKNISSNFTVSTSAGPSSSNGKGIIHRFPRKYVYNISEAAHSSTVPSSNSDTFRFIDT
ncbi:uncharacterized protein LOC103026087 isoform X8 [Astyanax mexicanus]|uniref:uncharacterized protein LOC103026087 isoform X7 n=1 Tax=Astyanax mexicanus TaxID=7994 RepID=UPI0020CAAF27|nr:uncharacterized protein LOC103026087 isoform X7 [Astyanax mexicanus]XP_049336903.1 uncharacterized protein LOC103026087 isoform X8 [Astyanax mexicanus]